MIQPRDRRGRFAPDFILWTRQWLDGAVRWVWWPKPPEYTGWPGPQ